VAPDGSGLILTGLPHGNCPFPFPCLSLCNDYHLLSHKSLSRQNRQSYFHTIQLVCPTNSSSHRSLQRGAHVHIRPAGLVLCLGRPQSLLALRRPAEWPVRVCLYSLNPRLCELDTRNTSGPVARLEPARQCPMVSATCLRFVPFHSILPRLLPVANLYHAAPPRFLSVPCSTLPLIAATMAPGLRSCSPVRWRA
jgi:hypothetical protein